MIDREDARKRARDYINSEAGAAVAEALGALLEGLEYERQANGDEDRERAHNQILASRADMEAAIGVRRVRRQRIVSTAAGEAPYRPVATAKDIDSIFTLSKKPSHVTAQRYGAFRILQDELGALRGGGPDDLESATLLLADMGYDGPQAKLDKASGIRARSVRQGVKSGGGPSAVGRWSLYVALGYTLGAEGRRDRDPSVWTLRAALHLRLIGPSRRPGPKPADEPAFLVGLEKAEHIVAAAWADIEDETKDREPNADPNARGDISPRALFRSAWRKGDADRRGNCINKSLKLRTK
jgi:hypothetical protein